jgi:asparagine synthase (glutamine-hydrolysing)
MPGISFAYAADGSLADDNQRILSSLDSLLHFPWYRREILSATPSYVLACTRYNEYPISSFETDKVRIWVEGHLYGKSAADLKSELIEVAMLAFEDPSDARGRLGKWLIRTNGDFVVFILNKDSEEILALTDALGHLPLYYCERDGLFLLSREMRFITNLLDSFRIDRVALTQYLLFSYPLGQRSYLDNVFRLGANSLVQVGLKSGTVRSFKIRDLNFEEKQHADRDLDTNARKLIEILTEECKAVTRSCAGGANVLGLSGGLDSRIVMLGMRKAALPFVAATRHDSGAASARDAEVARDLASLYRLDWQLFKLQPATFKDALKLLHMKNGLNYLGMSFILSFLERMRESYGPNMTYWTGDTGLVVRRELPAERLRTYDDLLDRILREHHVFDLRDVAGLLRTNVKAIRDELKSILEAYPEESLGQKFVHFVMHGRTMNWHYEGMDRNRCYFWLSAPLEFTPFFNYAMNCPDTQKSDYKLYRAILEQMSPESCRVTYAQTGLAPASFLFPLLLKFNSVIQKMPPDVRSRIKTLLLRNRQDTSPRSLITECIKQQVSESPVLREFFSRTYTENLLNRSTASQKYVLLTVTSVIEDFTSSKTCFEDYQEQDFT